MSATLVASIPLFIVYRDDLVVMFLAYAGCSGWIVYECRHASIPTSAIWGSWPQESRSWLFIGLVLPLLLSAIGAIWLSYYPLSFLAPDWVSEFLQARTTDDALALEPAQPIHNVLIALLVVLVAPVVEELFFRGMVLRRWIYKWGFTRAVVFSSLWFGCLHFDVLGATIFGIVMCVLYTHTRSLWIPIACHVLSNGLVMALEVIQINIGWSPLPSFPVTTEQLHATASTGMLFVLFSMPFLAFVVWNYWPRSSRPL